MKDIVRYLSSFFCNNKDICVGKEFKFVYRCGVSFLRWVFVMLCSKVEDCVIGDVDFFRNRCCLKVFIWC